MWQAFISSAWCRVCFVYACLRFHVSHQVRTVLNNDLLKYYSIPSLDLLLLASVFYNHLLLPSIHDFVFLHYLLEIGIHFFRPLWFTNYSIVICCLTHTLSFKIFIYAQECVGVCAHTCMCEWRPQVDIGCLWQLPSTLGYEARSLIEPRAHSFGQSVSKVSIKPGAYWFG